MRSDPAAGIICSVTENDLLRRFVDENAQDAFAELVRAKINLVYATALRQVGGDAHLAEDITQGVFVALACQAAKLKTHAVLTGWLYTTTRFIAAKTLRGQRRWQRREMEAHAMDTTPEPETAWRELRPVIDEAMHELNESDRAVVLLRFFEGRSLADVGSAVGVTENAARMRVERALEKLRGRLARRGIVSTAAALGVALTSQPILAAPASLAPAVTSVALGCATAGAVAGAGGVMATALKFMSTAKIILGTAAAIAVFGVGAFVGVQSIAPSRSVANAEDDPEFAHLKKENSRLLAELERLRAANGTGLKPIAGNSATDGATEGKGKWKFLVELSKQKLFSPRFAFLDATGNLSPAAAAIFDLTTEEQAALAVASDSARGKIEALEKSRATVRRLADNKVAIYVDPFPKEGGAVYDELTNAIGRMLGPERYSAFLTLGGEQLERTLGAFGAVEREIEVTSQPDSIQSRYLATDIQKVGGSRSVNSSNYKTKDDLIGRVGTIVKLLPADF
ncbi:MAG: sigma-70 family RNA polymerase sigma factor [Nibricoccus sp.]